MRFTRFGPAIAVCAAIFLAGLFASEPFDGDHIGVAATGECTHEGSMPDSGRIELQYLNASSQTDTVADYRLTMTLRWNDQAALECFDDGIIDWAYEHDLLYAAQFGSNVWSEDFSSFPSAAHPYLDTGALDDDATSLSFGIFRPETLSAGTTYRAA